MAIVFVFTDEEDKRAKKLGVNTMRLEDTKLETLQKFVSDPFLTIFMPFLKDKKEFKELETNFRNQVIMREIWTGTK